MFTAVNSMSRIRRGVLIQIQTIRAISFNALRSSRRMPPSDSTYSANVITRRTAGRNVFDTDHRSGIRMSKTNRIQQLQNSHHIPTTHISVCRIGCGNAFLSQQYTAATQSS